MKIFQIARIASALCFLVATSLLTSQDAPRQQNTRDQSSTPSREQNTGDSGRESDNRDSDDRERDQDGREQNNPADRPETPTEQAERPDPKSERPEQNDDPNRPQKPEKPSRPLTLKEQILNQRPELATRADLNDRIKEFERARDSYLDAQKDLRDVAKTASSRQRDNIRRQLQDARRDWSAKQREIKQLIYDEVKERFKNDRDRIIEQAKESRQRPGRD